MAQRFYEVGVKGIAAASGATYATIHTGANNNIALRELGIFVSAATATVIGLIRPSNSPVATTSTLGQAQDPAVAASNTNMDTAWSTAPTVGSAYLRQSELPATIGAGLIWTWWNGDGLIIPVSSYLVIWNPGASAGAAPYIYAVWEE